MDKQILIINGPNLNLLGTREVDIYGTMSFDQYLDVLKKKYEGRVEISYFQSNIEGEIVNALQQAREMDGIVLNAAAYTHTSVAIGDAVAAISVPVVEVHISNVAAREGFRQLSHISAKCVGTISGLGLSGYELAIMHLAGYSAFSIT